MKFFIIGDRDTVLGFRLAGIRGTAVQTAGEAEEALDTAFSQEDLGIIIITEQAAALVRSRVRRYQYTTSFPLIIEIPDRTGPAEDRGSVHDIVRKAVGVSL